MWREIFLTKNWFSIVIPPAGLVSLKYWSFRSVVPSTLLCPRTVCSLFTLQIMMLWLLLDVWRPSTSKIPAWSFVGTKTARNRHLGHGRGWLYCFCKTHFFALSLCARGARSIPVFWLEGFGTITRNETHKSVGSVVLFAYRLLPNSDSDSERWIDWSNRWRSLCLGGNCEGKGQLKSTHSAV